MSLQSSAVRIVGRWPLVYSAGADPTQDRPPRVRAGSGLAWVVDKLAVVQDDALWLALVDPHTLQVDVLPLPAPDGVRLFGPDRGNKASKPDFEAAVALPDGRLLLVGSGATAARMRWFIMDAPFVQIVDTSALYAAMLQLSGCVSAELNLEGATVHQGRLWLAQRSNGLAMGNAPRADALAHVDLAPTLAWLAGTGPLPDVTLDRTLDLGELCGVRLTLTDLCSAHGKLWFLAAAEASPNSYDDGEVVGSALGWLAEDAHAVWPIVDERGAVAPLKCEGLAADRTDERHFWAVVDADDPEQPCQLLRLRLEVS